MNDRQGIRQGAADAFRSRVALLFSNLADNPTDEAFARFRAGLANAEKARDLVATLTEGLPDDSP